MKKFYLFLFLSCLTLGGYAQTAASYLFSRITGAYSSISGSGTVSSAINCDDCTTSGAISLGFTFKFCGTNYTSFTVSSNGWISLQGLTYCCTYPAYATEIGYNGGSTIMANGWLFPFWFDGHGGYGGSNCYYQTTGSSGNHVFTFEWNTWDRYSNSSADINVQVKLFEATGAVQFCYGSNNYSGTDIGIGIANSQSDFQNLPSSGATSTVSSLPCCGGSTGLPANGSILQWCPPAAPITGNTPVCSGATITLGNTTTGGTWSSSATGTASVNSTSGVVTGGTAGTATITYTTGCGSIATTIVTVGAAPAVITGNAPVQACSSVTLADASGSGTWSSSNTAVGTVTSGGVLTGVSAGNANITFTLTSSGCFSITQATVSAAPAITGTGSICSNGTTVTLSDAFSGGTWTSSNSSQATVGPTNGIVTGAGVGLPTITYTISGGCFVTTPVTVNSGPAAITGSLNVCPQSTTTLSDATSGGTWTSSSPGVATVGSSSGVVSGISGGVATISYASGSTGCASISAVTVVALAPVTGTTSMCLGLGTTLADATGGGTWNSSAPGVATVNSSGVVTSVSTGSTTIGYTVASLGCTANVTVNVTGSPTAFSVTGGGSACPGSTVTVGVNSSVGGIIYTLFNGSTPVTTVTGAGFAFNFPPVSAAGIYGVVAASGTPCALSGSNTVTVNIYPVPVAQTVSGGGGYCAGTSGTHIFLNSSQIGVNYQVFGTTVGGPTPGGPVPVGSPYSGTGASMDLGLFTTNGTSTTYSISAVNTTTSCTNTMANTVVVTINPLPTVSTISPNSAQGYCTGGTGIGVSLPGTQTGVSYQLLLNGVPASGVSAISGTGGTISFGSQTVGGNYTILATNATTGCQATMTGTTVVTVNPLPTVFSVTGGGAYCSGGTGVAISLSGSQSGVNYQLYRSGVALAGAGNTAAGNGSSVSFASLQTTAGPYTVVATNSTTSCVNNMFGSSNVVINPLPTAFTVSAPFGSGYCVGGSGVDIRLSSSEVGATYQLYNGANPVGAFVAGSGSPIDFGNQTAAGNYTVKATYTATTCVNTMSSSVTVVINPLPTAYNVTVTGGGVYCAGGVGDTLGLSNSQTGVSYQLYMAGVAVSSVSPVSGTTGSSIRFLPAQTAAGAYSVVATNTTTTCINNMTGSASVAINPVPVAYSVTGGGGYCTGVTGARIRLAASDAGVNYQLMSGATPVGSALGGVGGALDFGLIPAGTYSVTATNATTGCKNGMSGTVNSVLNTLPLAFNVSAPASTYCAGGAGQPIGLDNSTTGVNYQLLRSGVAAGTAMPGTSFPLNFGNQTAGAYTVLATDAVTGCTNTQAGSVNLTTLPLPSVFTVTGGGSYCSGGAGAVVMLSGSTTGVNYQLYGNGIPGGPLVNGTGAGISFTPAITAGNYTVIATNSTTSCSVNMFSSVTVSVNALPTVYSVTGGGDYCAGGTGVPIGLSSSQVGITYQPILSGSVTGTPVPGSGGSIDFGMMTAGGSYTVLATNTSTGCTNTMAGNAVVVIDALPATHAVTGGGNYCPGSAGSTVGLNGSNLGTTYQLYNGINPAGASVAGTGSAISFGSQTGTGTYTAVATNGTTGCTNNMTGSVSVGVNPLPTIYNVTGGGNYCPSGAGVAIGVSGSSIGASYQLYRGATAVGASLPGTGFSLSFGNQIVVGTYTVLATTSTTSCTVNMFSNATVGISALPAAYAVTGGGDYCIGGIGVHIGLASSDAGSYYQLYNGITPAGGPMAGTGASLDFGLQTGTGTYTITGTNTASGCTNTMTGSVPVNIITLPTAYSVTGGGAYCTGGTGSDIMLSSSDIGLNYQLYYGGTPAGSPMAGTGTSLDFGPQTGAGNYTVVATDGGSTCRSTMSGTANVSINALPTAYNVTGGGNYCAGGTGVHLSISGSDVGTQYQLMNSSGNVGAPMAGTGFGLDFGLQTVADNYTIVATNAATTCMNNMNGSAAVGINPTPSVYTISGSGGSYCAGGAGVDVALSGSDAGTNYQLYNGPATVGGIVAGGGLPIDFGQQTASGSYTVMAVNAITGCRGTMAGSANITINPLPPAFTVTGGGSYCAGGTGVNIGLSGSNVGVGYKLFNGHTAVGTVVIGTGSGINLGLRTGAGNYTVVATNLSTTCANNMTGSATVAVNALPSAYPVTGGGSYCTGGTGVSIGLAGSAAGVDYQLRRGSTSVGAAVSGTGFPLSFSDQTVAGNYSVVATNTATGCVATMAGTAAVTINSLPTTYTVTGGGSYCTGGVGVRVGLSGSTTGVNYQLYNGTSPAGPMMSGTGSAIDFGLQTGAGTYTVVATNGTTLCSSNMSGGVTINVGSLPTVFAVTGGGNYCAGGAGMHIGLSSSTPGISYQLYIAGTPVGTPVVGTGSTVDLGAQTTAGTYTVLGTNGVTGCTNMMSGTATIGLSPVVAPAVTISTGVGDTVCSGSLTTFTAMTVNGGSSPLYQWKVNGTVTGSGNSYSYIPINGDVVSIMVTSSASCAMPAAASSSVAMTVNTSQLPDVTVSANPGTRVCQATNVMFTATPVYGGTAPTYSWIVGGVNMGSGTTFSYVPANGDIIYAIMTSNYRCRLANTASSTHITMQVDMPTAPTVSITANPGLNVAAGQNVMLTAAVSNGGPAPTYQWFINGAAQSGATMNTFSSSNFANGDSVSCEVMSSGGCAGISGNSYVIMHVSTTGVAQVSLAGSDIKLVPNPSKGIFTIKGSLGVTTDEEVNLEMTDMMGQVILSKQVTAHNGTLNEVIQLNGKLANGMYMLNLRSGAESKVFHVVIEQ